MNETQTLIAFLAILLIFGWIGRRRGTRAELSTLAFIVLTQALIRNYGDVLLFVINNLYRAVRFVLAGGLFVEDPTQVFAKVRNVGPLIGPEVAPVFWLVVTLALIWLGYQLNRLKWFKGKASLLGGLAGMVNGYTILSILLPKLPRQIPDVLTLLEQPSQRGQIAAQVRSAARPVTALVDEHSTYVTLAVIGVILYLIVRTIQPEKKGG